jgi:glyoxylase-like metal-dependent hydrolase (beta-lactamase superfamily II)
MHPLRITDRIYALKGRWGISPLNMWIYAIADRGSSRLLLIDSGGSGSSRSIARALQEMGRSFADIAGIALTHWHADHTGGLRELLGRIDHPVTIYGGAADMDILLAQEALPLKVRPFVFAPWGLQVPHRPGKLSTRQDISYVRLTPENHGSALEEWDIEALPTPGHTPGQTTYHLLPERVLFCGDALMHLAGHIYTLGFHHDLEQMDASAQWLLRQEFDWLLPAHVTPVRRRVPLERRENIGGQARGAVGLLERFTAFKYQGTVGR